MEVLDLEADLYDYKYNTYAPNDYQVSLRYESPHSYTVIVRRLDSSSGWDDNFSDLHVLVNYTSINHTEIVHIGKSPLVSVKEVLVQCSPIKIAPSTVPIVFFPSYTFASFPEPSKLSREDFNLRFNTDIVYLPRELYAIGLDNNKVFMYNDFFADYFEMLASVKHIICTALTFTSYQKFYFIFDARDGYIEDSHYYNNRYNPYIVGVEEFKHKHGIELSDPTVYPIWHSKRYIFAMSNQCNIPYTIGIPDKHFFYCNLYNGFRSFHKGLVFSNKISKIVYASRTNRSTKYNFLTRPDIILNQREYFMSDAVPKTNIICAGDGSIQATDMIQYKYILDIDGYSSTWDATAWKMNSGSVLFKTNSRWRQWFYEEFKPWIHYVPIKDDFSDIDQKYEWCESHQEECKRIVANAKKLFQTVYRLDNIFKYTIKAIEMII